MEASKKTFITDQLVEEDNFCNFLHEKTLLTKYVDQGAKVVLFGPRNYGKTSLLKNILIKNFEKEHKQCFVFFADLMEVKSMESLVSRLAIAFERSFEHSFPAKTFLRHVTEFLSSVRPEVTLDPLTGAPSVSLGFSSSPKTYSIETVFRLILAISKRYPSLVVIDEFQDIARIPEAQAMFRAAFQNIGSLPTILLGSKRHILSEIFSNPGAPLAFWGQDVQLNPIAYEVYHTYIQERFLARGLVIDMQTATYLQELMNRIPESVNLLCIQIMAQYENTSVTHSHVLTALRALLIAKESRYESYLGNFSLVEQTVLTALAKTRTVTEPQSKHFVQLTRLTSRTVGKTVHKLYDHGVLEKEMGAYRLSDPVLGYYLQYYR